MYFFPLDYRKESSFCNFISHVLMLLLYHSEGKMPSYKSINTLIEIFFKKRTIIKRQNLKFKSMYAYGKNCPIESETSQLHMYLFKKYIIRYGYRLGYLFRFLLIYFICIPVTLRLRSCILLGNVVKNQHLGEMLILYMDVLHTVLLEKYLIFMPFV